MDPRGGSHASPSGAPLPAPLAASQGRTALGCDGASAQTLVCGSGTSDILNIIKLPSISYSRKLNALLRYLVATIVEPLWLRTIDYFHRREDSQRFFKLITYNS